MKDKIKKGQAFIGIDDEKYYFLGYDYNNQIQFTTLDLWTDQEQKYIEKNNVFIKKILDEKSDIIENCTWYYQSISELEKSSMEEKIKRCLDIIYNANTQEIELKPTEVGPLVRGQAYSKEYNQYYEVIGFIVENNIYVDDELKARQKGLFSIYHSNCENTVSLIFERNYSDSDNSFEGKHFISSNDTRVDIEEIIYDKDEVNMYIDNQVDRLVKKDNYIVK